MKSFTIYPDCQQRMPLTALEKGDESYTSIKRSWIKILSFVTICLVTFSVGAQVNIRGTAPVQTPLGGFAVDGDAFAGQPAGYTSVGDWFIYSGTAPDGIFPANINFDNVDQNGGLKVGDWPYPNTYFFRDDITNMDPTIFTSSNKINDNPKSYTWGAGSSPNKNEIQNAMVHFSFGDPSLTPPGDPEDLWVLFAADREVTNGSSYIDFEFLQQPLSRTGLTAGAGGFITEAPDATGGRTVGDVLITLEFTQGGGAANVVVRKWQLSGGVYQYVIFIQNPTGEKVLYSTNNTTTIQVPYPLYNQSPVGPNRWQYSINQWAEGAANLTQIFGNADPCFNISTLFVRTRTSGSSGQSELKDFPGGPVQLELDLNPVADITTAGACAGEDAIFTATPAGADDYTFFFDADEDGIVGDTETIYQQGTVDFLTIKTLSDGDVVSVRVTTNGVCNDVDAVAAIINDNPDASFTVDDACEVSDDDDITVVNNSTASEGGTLSYAWIVTDASDLEVATSELENPSFDLEPGDYTISLIVTESGADCTDSTSESVTVYSNPDLTADEVCVGDTVDMGIGSGTYSSSDTSVATIDSDGVVTGVSAGTSTISFENTNGCSDTAIVTVYANPDLTADEVCVGDTVDMGIGSGTYSSSDTSVATIDSDGVVTGVSAGTSTISFENTNGCSDTAIVTVYANPDLTADEVCVGDTVDMGIGSGTYSSSDTSVATIDSDGVVTGVSAGTSTISFENTNGCSDTAIVTVYANPDLTADEVCVGDTVDMGIGSGTYSSSDTSVATIDSDGVVTGVSAGTSTISFENTNGCSDTAIVTVYANPDLTADEVCVGDTVDMGIGSGTYSSSDTSVATIDSDGVVTGVSAGTSTISFENTNGCSDTAIVTVYANPDLTADEVCVGDTVDMGIGSGTYSSSDTSVATIDSDGVVTGVSAGTSTISFENTNGCSDTAIVTVYANPDLTAYEVCVGDTVDMGIGSGTYSSSDTSVATIDSDGVVTGVSAGTSTISFENTNGCSDTAIVTVYANPDLTDANVCVGQTVDMGIGAGDYTSSNILVATVDSNGTVSGISAGTATISYENGNGCKDSATVTVENCIVDEGCTPGYWKNHLEAWVGADPSEDFFAFFNIDPVGANVQDIIGDMDQNADGIFTLLEAISAEEKTSKNNGWFAALARHAVAAYLNASNPDVGYEFSTSYILSKTEAVFEADYRNRNEANAAAQALHNQFRIANERVCRLGDTSQSLLADTSVLKISDPVVEEPLVIEVQKENLTLESTTVNDFNVYPVPFKESLNIQYQFDYVSDVTIQFFDMRGQLLRSYKEQNATRGVVTTLSVDFALSANQIYIVKVITDRDQFSKKIVSSK